MIPLVVWLLLANGGESLTRGGAVRARLASRTSTTAHLARRWHVESVFGTLTDPFADKLLVIASLVALAVVDRGARLDRRRDRRPRGVGHAAARPGASAPASSSRPARSASSRWPCRSAVLLAIMTLDLTGAALHVLLYAMVAITVASGVEVALRARRRHRAGRRRRDATLARRGARAPGFGQSWRGCVEQEPRSDMQSTSRDAGRVSPTRRSDASSAEAAGLLSCPPNGHRKPRRPAACRRSGRPWRRRSPRRAPPSPRSRSRPARRPMRSRQSRSPSPRRSPTPSCTPTWTDDQPGHRRGARALRGRARSSSWWPTRVAGCSRAPTARASGLGLPLIAQMTQSLEVHDRDGGGTEIRMAFALERAPPERRRERPAPGPTPLRNDVRCLLASCAEP